MKLRINEKDEIVVEPWGFAEEEEYRHFAEKRFHLDIVKAKMVPLRPCIKQGSSPTKLYPSCDPDPHKVL